MREKGPEKALGPHTPIVPVLYLQTVGGGGEEEKEEVGQTLGNRKY